MRDNKKSNAILVEQLRRMEEIHWKLCWSWNLMYWNIKETKYYPQDNAELRKESRDLQGENLL
jgi:hypothetical protein